MRALSALLLVAVAAGCGGGSAGGPDLIEYEPHTVLAIPAEGDIADPHVIKVGSTWYLYATNSSVELRVWTSEDLHEWNFGGAVWTPTPGTWNDPGGIWAPHVEVADEGYYLYITADTRIGVAFSGSPLGPFEDVYDHPLVGDGYGGVGDGHLGDTPMDFDERAIDAFVLRDDDGSLTFYFCAYDPVSKIHAVPMIDHVTLADQEPRIVLKPEEAWESVIVEGAWVEKHEGRYHLMYSGNFFETASYAIGIAWADDPMGPFTRYPDNPILKANTTKKFYGPGHHSVVEGARDDLLMFYHTKVIESDDAERRLRYAPISFDRDGLISVSQP